MTGCKGGMTGCKGGMSLLCWSLMLGLLEASGQHSRAQAALTPYPGGPALCSSQAEHMHSPTQPRPLQSTAASLGLTQRTPTCCSGAQAPGGNTLLPPVFVQQKASGQGQIG